MSELARESLSLRGSTASVQGGRAPVSTAPFGAVFGLARQAEVARAVGS
jgi:hypothetical protein